jgi:hypothetical protein
MAAAGLACGDHELGRDFGPRKGGCAKNCDGQFYTQDERARAVEFRPRPLCRTPPIHSAVSALMLRHSFLYLLSGIALMPGAAIAAEASPLSAGYTQSITARLETRLTREGYILIGEPRRKGDFVILTASRASVPWRLVVDGRTGEIIGQKPLSPGND